MTTIWTVAALSSSSWNLPMDELTLINRLSSLELSWGSLDRWLKFWILLVVIGVSVELVVICVEYSHELHDFRRGIIHAPEAPSGWLLFCALLGAGLVAIGVAGEFFIHIKAGRLETEMRDVAARLVATVDAKAAEAQKETARLRKEASELRKIAEDERLARVKMEQQFANRHIPHKDVPEIIRRLSVFAGQKAVIDVFPVTFEHVALAMEIEGILGNAHWEISPPNRLQTPPSGGILVSGVWYEATADERSQAAARALWDAIGSYTSGVRAPMPLSNPENPRVWIYVGDAPIPLRDWVK